MAIVTSKQQRDFFHSPETSRVDVAPETTIEMPSYGKMLKGLAKSSYAIAKSGVKIVSNEKHEERFTICSKCHHLVDGRCMVCGCFMQVKSKFEATNCSLGKW